MYKVNSEVLEAALKMVDEGTSKGEVLDFILDNVKCITGDEGGRPRKIDYEELKELKGKGWTNKKIAEYFSCSLSAVEKAWKKIKE